MRIGLIPARAGSKGIRGKNMRPVAGKPLVVHTMELMRDLMEAGVLDRWVVTTDDPAVSAHASILGADNIGRPHHLASDHATLDDTITWAWTELDPAAQLLVIQPTIYPTPSPDLIRTLMTAGAANKYTLFATQPYRHILWRHNKPLTPRQNRQFIPTSDTIGAELGIRYYHPADPTPRSYDIGDCGLIDIDTLGDLAAATQMAERRNILFRVVAGEQVGYGHLYRTMAIAEELQHHNITFHLDPHSLPGQHLPGWWKKPTEILTDHGWPLLPEGIEPTGDIVVHDTLGMAHWMSLDTPNVTIEDQSRNARHADLIINALYPARPDHPYPQELNGPRFAVLRPEFLSLPDKPTPDEITTILITFGGADPAHLTEKVHDWVTEWTPNVRVIAPPARQINIKGHLTNPSMVEEMHNADLIITSAGRTLYEAMACGTPAIVLSQNPRETTHVHLGPEWGNLHLGMGAVAHRADFDKALTAYMWNDHFRNQMFNAVRGQVDGWGARRIAKRIEDVLLVG